MSTPENDFKADKSDYTSWLSRLLWELTVFWLSMKAGDIDESKRVVGDKSRLRSQYRTKATEKRMLV